MKNNYRLFIVLSFLSIMFCSKVIAQDYLQVYEAYANSQYGGPLITIDATITSGGYPVPNAQITFRYPSGKYETLVSDTYGRVCIVLPYGRYDLGVTASSYENYYDSFTLDSRYSSLERYGLPIELQRKTSSTYNNSYNSYDSYNSYNSSNYNSSNNYNSSSSDGVSIGGVIAGAAIIGGAIALIDALTDDSSNGTSQKNGFEITDVKITHESLRQNNGSMWYFDHAAVYYKNKNSYSVKVVLLIKQTDGSSFKTPKMTIDPYDSDVVGWNSSDNKKIKGVEIYSVEKAY